MLPQGQPRPKQKLKKISCYYKCLASTEATLNYSKIFVKLLKNTESIFIAPEELHLSSNNKLAFPQSPMGVTSFTKCGSPRWGFGVVLLNPLRTRRFAESDLQRTKTDKIDDQTIAHVYGIAGTVGRLPNPSVPYVLPQTRFNATS